MTLIIAGYDHEEPISYEFLDGNTPPKKHKEMIPCGIFAISDSAITTTEGKTILNGFQKLYEIEAKLWKPYFQPDGAFRDYREVYDTRNVLVGFSGSTLTAQHILNSINGHLSKLRISCSDEDSFSSITYEVIRHCQSNPLRARDWYWNDDTFLDKDFQGLLTGSLIAKIVEHSINTALKSASRYKLSDKDLNTMRTDFFCGVWCPYQKRHELYEFRMQDAKDEHGMTYAHTEKRLVEENETLVLGMRQRFTSEAQDIFEQSLAARKNPTSELLEFMKQCIDLVNEEGNSLIDRPIVVSLLDQNKIQKKVIKD